MVLKNSKWDKRAKTKYLKKHGLFKRPEPSETEQRPKWSSKRPGATNQHIILDASDSEWDSEDEEGLLNQYYPEIGKENLTREQKEKIKQQILQDLIEEQEDLRLQLNENEYKEDEPAGIYLGSEENQIKERNEKQENVKLGSYISNDPIIAKAKKNRKLPKNKMQDNLLEEYGLEKYSDTVKKDINDYSLPYTSKKLPRNVDKISNSELDGFRIGDSLMSKSKVLQKDNHIVRNLTKDEMREHKERAAKSEQNKFYNQIKNRFNTSESDPGKKPKVIEINNFNDNDEQLLQYLNAKLAGHDLNLPAATHTKLDEDIELLLGNPKTLNGVEKDSNFCSSSELKNSDNIDDFLSSLNISNENDSFISNKNNQILNRTVKPESSLFFYDPNTQQDQDFLDDLLN